MNYIMAVLFMCYVGGGCTQTTVRVEHTACGKSYRGEAAQNGQWVPVRVGVRCR